jgi:hypothetical protein
MGSGGTYKLEAGGLTLEETWINSVSPVRTVAEVCGDEPLGSCFDPKAVARKKRLSKPRKLAFGFAQCTLARASFGTRGLPCVALVGAGSAREFFGKEPPVGEFFYSTRSINSPVERYCSHIREDSVHPDGAKRAAEARSRCLAYRGEFDKAIRISE